MQNISEYIVNKLFVSLNEEEQYELQFGVELILTQSILISIIIFSGVMLGRFVESLVFILLLLSVRTVLDGYHAKTFLKCCILTLCIYFFVMLTCYASNVYIFGILSVISMIYGIRCIIFKRNELRIGGIIICAYVVVSTLLLCDYTHFSHIIINTLFLIILSKEIEKWKKIKN